MGGYGLRSSQFIFTYGVGSVIETSSGPRLIPGFDRWGQIFYKGSTRNVSDFQIDLSLHKDILDGSVFAIPTNILLDKKEDEGIYKTVAFPDWGLCIEHRYLFEYDDERTRCPECKKSRSEKRRQGVRFVRACPGGHLDDIDWRSMIKHASSCTRRVYRWEDLGGTLDDVRIVCDCSGETTMQKVYNISKRCTGRFPERATDPEECALDSQVVLLGSSMLRIPYLLSIIAIPGPASPLHKTLGKKTLMPILTSYDDPSKAELIERIDTTNKNLPGTISKEDIEIIKKANDAILSAAISDVISGARKSSPDMEGRRRYEFRTLKNAARNGHPIDQRDDPYFGVPKNRIRSDDNGSAVELTKTKKLRVSPIEKLRAITVQRGYQRLGTENSDRDGVCHSVVDTYYLHNDEKWYPGIEQIGEGIFVDDHDEELHIDSDEWLERFRAMEKRTEYHPVFVWWHSLAHRLISAISLHSGYSPASIREMIYVEIEPSGEARGGILLYTSQPGADGSLGGLVSKVPKFERIIDHALNDLEFCSNDPLCYEQKVEDVGDFGSSCYACLYLPETSCPHFNRFLDRGVLLNSLRK